MSLAKDEKAKIVKKFGKSAKDTGSTATQVALLTKRIEELQSHFKKHNITQVISRNGLSS